MKTITYSIVLALSLGLCARAFAVDRINITEPPYGATPNSTDGSFDNNAINAAVAAGKSIYFPPGIYHYQGSITLPSNQSYRLYGDGPGVSTIVFTGNPSTAGIYGPNMGTNTLEVDGLTLQANTKSCGFAIKALFNQAGTDEKFRSATLHNLQIIGSTRTGSTGAYWTGGIYLSRAQNAVIDGVEMNGNAREDETGGGSATQYGIVWTSDSYRTTGLQLSNLITFFCNTALYTSGAVEGLYLNGFEFAFCGNFGMPAVNLSSSISNLGSAFHLVNGHVSPMEHGIQLTSLRDVRISKVHIVHSSGNQFAKSGNDITLTNCTDAVISDGSFVGVDGGDNYPNEICINLINSDAVQVIGNYFTHVLPQGTGICIAADSNSDTLRIINNVFEKDGVGYGSVKQAYSVPPGTYKHGNNL
jgi:hypothetical protein